MEKELKSRLENRHPYLEYQITFRDGPPLRLTAPDTEKAIEIAEPGMKRRLLLKTPEPGHDERSKASTHDWFAIKRTRKSIIYQCLKCERLHYRKIAHRGAYKRKEK